MTQAKATGASKIGLHTTSNNSPSIMDFVRQAQPAVVVAVGQFSWLNDVKAASPKTITVGRLPEGDQTMSGDPVVKAHDFVNANLSLYRANPQVEYWLGWNEPVIKTVQQMQWYAAFEAERAIAMATVGLKVAIGNFSTGTPEANQFEAFLPAVAAIKTTQGILALHEYSAPSMTTGTGDAIPGVATLSSSGSLTLRYRYWYEHYLRPMDLVVPLIVTEAGLDGGVMVGGTQSGNGWRDILTTTNGVSISLDDAWKSYASQLSWYDDELRRDPYVLGFAVFNVGDLSSKWKSFDVTDHLPQLAEIAKAKN